MVTKRKESDRAQKSRRACSQPNIGLGLSKIKNALDNPILESLRVRCSYQTKGLPEQAQYLKFCIRVEKVQRRDQIVRTLPAKRPGEHRVCATCILWG